MLSPYIFFNADTVAAATSCTVTEVGEGYHVEITAGEGETVAVGIDEGRGSPGRPFDNNVRGEINVSALDPATGTFSAFHLCADDPNANVWEQTVWLSIGGTEDGHESIVFWHPHRVNSGDAIHVGDTVDELTLNYGAIPSPPYPVGADLLYDMSLVLATAKDGTLVGDTDYSRWPECDLTIPGSVALTVVGGSDPFHLSVLEAYGRQPGFKACHANDVIDDATEDDVPAGVKPFTGDLTYLGGTGRGDSFSPGTGMATFIGGDGLNSLEYHYARRAVVVDLRAGTATGWGIQTFSGVVDVYGSNYDDAIIGSAQANVLYGLGGNDRMRGLGGDDVILGNEGDDRLKGGAGDDLLIGAQGSDVCVGGAGADDFVKCERRRQ